MSPVSLEGTNLSPYSLTENLGCSIMGDSGPPLSLVPVVGREESSEGVDEPTPKIGFMRGRFLRGASSSVS